MSEKNSMEGKYSNTKAKMSWKYYFIFTSWLFLCLLSFYLGIGLIHWDETVAQSNPKKVYQSSMGDGVVKAFQEENQVSHSMENPLDSDGANKKNILEELFSVEIGNPSSTENSKNKIRSSTWFSDYEAMKKVVHLYDEIHPFIYSMKGGLSNTGELANSWSSTSKRERIAELRSLNPKVKIIPTIFRWENPKEKISENIGMNGRSDIRDKHIKIIVDEVVNFGYDGIDIDYEGMSCDKKEKFEEFIVLLSKELKKHNKLLSVAVHPKTPNSKSKLTKCKGLKNDILVDFKENWRGPMTHDYEFLGKHVDRLKVMAYELHPRKYRNPGPGPQAPNTWLKEIIRYAKKKVPSEKLYMAIPTYGYDWALNCNLPAKSVYFSDVNRIKTLAPTIHQPTDITTILSKGNRASNWTNLSKFSWVHENKIYEDPTLWYQSGGCDRVAFFMNRKAFEEKMTLLRKYEVAGFSFWQLISDNDPGINDYLELLSTNKVPDVEIATDLYDSEKIAVADSKIKNASNSINLTNSNSEKLNRISNSNLNRIEKQVEIKKTPLKELQTTFSATSQPIKLTKENTNRLQKNNKPLTETIILPSKPDKMDSPKVVETLNTEKKTSVQQTLETIEKESVNTIPVDEMPTSKPQEIPNLKPLKEDIIYE